MMDWRCNKCTFINGGEKKRCKLCLTWRRTSVSSSSQGPPPPSSTKTTTKELFSSSAAASLSRKREEDNLKRESKRIKNISKCNHIGLDQNLLFKDENQHFLRNPETSLMGVLARIASLTTTAAAAKSSSSSPSPSSYDELSSSQGCSQAIVNLDRPPIKKKKRNYADKMMILQQETLIRYGFEIIDQDATDISPSSNQIKKELVWYVGEIRSSWKKNHYYDVMFEDGEELCVQLTPQSKGRYWEVVKDFKKQKKRFDVLIRSNLSNPHADISNHLVSTPTDTHIPHVEKRSQRKTMVEEQSDSIEEDFQIETFSCMPSSPGETTISNPTSLTELCTGTIAKTTGNSSLTSNTQSTESSNKGWEFLENVPTSEKKRKRAKTSGTCKECVAESVEVIEDIKSRHHAPIPDSVSAINMTVDRSTNGIPSSSAPPTVKILTLNNGEFFAIKADEISDLQIEKKRTLPQKSRPLRSKPQWTTLLDEVYTECCKALAIFDSYCTLPQFVIHTSELNCVNELKRDVSLVIQATPRKYEEWARFLCNIYDCTSLRAIHRLLRAVIFSVKPGPSHVMHQLSSILKSPPAIPIPPPPFPVADGGNNTRSQEVMPAKMSNSTSFVNSVPGSIQIKQGTDPFKGPYEQDTFGLKLPPVGMPTGIICLKKKEEPKAHKEAKGIVTTSLDEEQISSVSDIASSPSAESSSSHEKNPSLSPKSREDRFQQQRDEQVRTISLLKAQQHLTSKSMWMHRSQEQSRITAINMPISTNIRMPKNNDMVPLGLRQLPKKNAMSTPGPLLPAQPTSREVFDALLYFSPSLTAASPKILPPPPPNT